MINETVLEMHYHKPLMDLFRETYGIGVNGQLNFYKYSTQRECFIGFDQAYVATEMPDEDFFSYLKDSAANSSYKLPDVFVGYFLQFKVVKKMVRSSINTPSLIKNNPHYRVSLDTLKNSNTGQSQHELLYKLNKNAAANVYYACPMIFDKADLYEVDVDFANLSLTDMASCPSVYDDNVKHFLYYKSVSDNAIWCSDPVEGESMLPKTFVNKIIGELKNADPRVSADALRKILTSTDSSENGKTPSGRHKKPKRILDLLGDSLTIVVLKQQE